MPRTRAARTRADDQHLRPPSLPRGSRRPETSAARRRFQRKRKGCGTSGWPGRAIRDRRRDRERAVTDAAAAWAPPPAPGLPDLSFLLPSLLLAVRCARIPSPRVRGEGFADPVVGKARRQPTVRGLSRRRLFRKLPHTLASASPPLPGCTTGCSWASPRPRGEGEPAGRPRPWLAAWIRSRPRDCRDGPSPSAAWAITRGRRTRRRALPNKVSSK